MKKNITAIVAAILISTFSLFASAAPGDTGTTSFGTISELRAYKPYTILKMAGETSTCSKNSSFFYIFDAGHEHMISTAIAAFLSGKETAIYWECTSNDYTEITLVRVK